VSCAFVGALIGPFLGFLFFVARIGPAGHFWWQGKGGETFLTPLGKFILVSLFVGGAYVGVFCGWAIDARSRPGETEVLVPKGTPERKKPSPRGTLNIDQDLLWDKDLDG